MKNPVFKAEVDAIFKKASFLQNPNEVAQKMPHADSGDLRRGLALAEGAKGVASGAKDILGKGYRGLSALASPAAGGLAARGVASAGKFFLQRPKLMRAAVGTAALAPILGGAFDASQKHHEAELMNAYADPSRVITASLEDFLEKKAELHAFTKFSAAPAFNPSHSLLDGLTKGVGSALGGSVAALLAHAIGAGFDAIRESASHDPKRAALVQNVLKTDPVLSDAMKRHPETKRMVDEAYATMVRFAPTLSLDLNAVRSFLREAVLGGSGVNYATIKNLVDTEKSIAEAKPKYGRK